jgi:membrane protein implicated in regulation of membrane protease activity
MKIVPNGIEEHIDRIDPLRRRWIGISFGVLAAGSAFRVFWMIFASLAYGFLGGSLVFSIVFWVVIGLIGVVAAVAFLKPSVRRPEHDRTDS